MRLKKLALMSMVVLATMSACGVSKKGGTDSTDAKTATEAKTDEKAPSDYGSVELGNYIGVEIPNIDTSVSDQDVDAQINTELQQDPDKEQITDRPVQEGDTVNIDYTGTKDGVAFDGGSAKGYDLVIGSNNFIEGFESGLIGHNIGEDVQLNLTFPSDYNNKDLAGAAVVFDVKINSISVSKPATLTDEWVSKHTGGAQTTVDAYKAEVKKQIEDQRKKSAEQQDQYNALTAVMKNSTYKLNDKAVDYEYDSAMEPINNMIKQYGMTIEQYAQAYGTDEEGLKAKVREQAESVAKERVTIDAIYKKEKMSLKDEDYQKIIEASGLTTTKDELIKQYGKDKVEQAVKSYKVVNFLVEKAKRSASTVNLNGETIGSEEGQTSAESAGEAAESSATESQAEETTAAESESAQSSEAAH